jgi:hypothetical protein
MLQPRIIHANRIGRRCVVSSRRRKIVVASGLRCESRLQSLTDYLLARESHINYEFVALESHLVRKDAAVVEKIKPIPDRHNEFAFLWVGDKVNVSQK